VYFLDRFSKKPSNIKLNSLTPNDLQRRRAVRPLKIEIPNKSLGRQRCAEKFNSGVEGLMQNQSSWNPFFPYDQRDGQDEATLIVALHNFANATNNFIHNEHELNYKNIAQTIQNTTILGGITVKPWAG
jgi:hypothetical protein